MYIFIYLYIYVQQIFIKYIRSRAENEIKIDLLFFAIHRAMYCMFFYIFIYFTLNLALTAEGNDARSS